MSAGSCSPSGRVAVLADPVGPCTAAMTIPPFPTPAALQAGEPPVPAATSRRIYVDVARAQHGDRQAFGRLYDEYCDTVYRYVYYRVGAKATAEDLTSETFLRALRRIGTFTWQGRDFGAWLVTIARNLVADHFKSSRFRLEVTTGGMLDANEAERSTEDVVLESLSSVALLRALQRLPDRMREVTWSWATGAPVATIARDLGIAPATVRVHLHQARLRLASDPDLADVHMPARRESPSASADSRSKSGRCPIGFRSF
ncbi:sigma-70 family RNA polymerase sigma factor [Streptomyces sp. NPDC001651]|uniref:sigma-70 family RNA polymerase sigma factor n=1 Tax=Streptomyces sp. NPDC001651 TaxID=3364596 RepID=UPI0036A9DD85